MVFLLSVVGEVGWYDAGLRETLTGGFGEGVPFTFYRARLGLSARLARLLLID